jgi:AraC family transcriptional regulator
MPTPAGTLAVNGRNSNHIAPFALRRSHRRRKFGHLHPRNGPEDVTRKVLFESERLQIRFFAARNVSHRLGEVEEQDRNLVVLPLSGLFAKHDAPNRQSIGTPSHAVFFAADTPYRTSYPGAKGDSAIVLRFDNALAEDHTAMRQDRAPASSGLLDADTLLLRSLLCTQLKEDHRDPFEIETRGLDLLAKSLSTIRPRHAFKRESSEVRWTRATARMTEAVAASPSSRWTVERLSRIAGQSPYHLCRIFRERTGASVCDYVLRERLAASLVPVLDGADLTTTALDFGFASHSHFTARFRSFFGATPAELRRQMKADQAKAAHIGQLRKIMTAA